ncbi:MAG: hypothetical protein ACTSVI_13630 [Promethearchaeota archaeon]
MSNKRKCSTCGATESGAWYKCVVCGSWICDQCGVECDGCGGMYCIDKCGTDYIDETSYHVCFNCKRGK